MSSKQPKAPTPPSAQETASASIQAQINAIPQMLAAQQQYGSQFTQLSLDELKNFGPQFADAQLSLEKQFGPQFAQSTVDTAKILTPESVAAQEQLKKYFESGPPQLNEEQQRQSINAVTDATAFRGLGESGFSATEALKRMVFEQQSLNDQFYNKALSAAGRTPTGVTSSAQANPLSYGPGQLVQNVDPGQYFGYQSGLNSLNQNAYQFGQNNRGNLGGVGALVGAGIGGMFGGVPGAKLGAGIGSTAGGSFKI